MRGMADRGLVAFCGSETRVSTLGVLANAERPLTGYRISKLAGLQPIKVYRELERAIRAGLVGKSESGYRLLDRDVRTLLQKRVRVSWSEAWFADEGERAKRSRKVLENSVAWYDPRRYKSNSKVAKRYATEIQRPPEKDKLSQRVGVGPSRKQR